MNINVLKDKMNELIDKAYKVGYNDGTNFSEEAHACTADYKPDDAGCSGCSERPVEKHDCNTCSHLHGGFESLKNYCVNCDGCYWVPKTSEKTTSDDETDNAIKIGDEIEFEGHVCLVILVHKYIGKDTYNVLSNDGHYWSGVLWLINETTANKTGRHFDQVAELYKKMKED